jgi:GNAT superfamily N-acetyltransferase
LNAITRDTAFKTRPPRLRHHSTMTASASPSPSFHLRTGYEPGAIGRIGELHGRYYAVAWGSGAAFEIQMLRELCDFVERDDPARGLLVTTHVGDTLIGSLGVMLVDTESGAPDTHARLRFVIVDPAFQGLGAGRAMLDTALAWCRARGIRTVFLWTVDGLPASRALYERAGFRVVERVDDARYSVPLTNLKMVLELDPQAQPF